MSSPDTVTDQPTEEEKPKLNLEVTIEEPSACERHVTVKVPREDIDRYMKDAFEELQPKAEVPGFRPGRAPRKLVESRFKEQIADQVKGSLLMDSMTQVTEGSELSAISEPDFDFDAVTMPDDGPLTFEFDIEVRPEFDMPEWKGLKLDRLTHKYSEAELDDRLQKLLARYGELEVVEDKVSPGDYISADIAFRHEDTLISEVEEETIQVQQELSFQDASLDNFAKLVKGKKAGDNVTTSIKISDSAEAEHLRGKDVDAEIAILEVKRMNLPKLDRQFLDRIGGFEDEDDLRGAVRDELERQFKYHQQQEIRKQITELLTKDADLALPPDLLQRQSRRELQRAVLELQSAGFNNDDIQAHANALRQNSTATTERALKEHFILERIAEENEIEVQPEDYDEEVRLIADQSNESPRRVRARLEKRNQMDALRNQIVERKAIDLICEQAKFKDVPYQPKQADVAAIDHAVAGSTDEGEPIPEAKHPEEAGELRQPADRT